MLEKAHVFTSRNKQLVAIEHIPDKKTAHSKEQSAELKSKALSCSQGVIIVVGGPQTRVGSHRLFVLLSRALAKNGVHVFRFDYTGAGDSEGEAAEFTDIQEDISQAVAYFRQQQPQLVHFTLWGLCDAASAILLYLAQYPKECLDIHRLVLVNPWVSQAHTKAQTYLKSYYLKRFFSKDFWKKFLTGKINTRNTLNEVHGFHKQSKSLIEKNNFVEQMLQGLNNFEGKSHIILSGNDLTADEFVLLVKNNPDWNRIASQRSVSTEKIKEANHTFSALHCQQLLIEETLKSVLLK
jgi:exosortase A-associated hydrolase 1